MVYDSVTEAVQSQRAVTSRLDQLSRMASCHCTCLRFQPLIVDVVHVVLVLICFNNIASCTSVD